jgi:hypothetical protein
LKKLKEIVDLFYIAMRMIINIAKSTISLWGISEMEINFITYMFPYNMVELETGMKYLGFQLKANLYKKKTGNG